MSAHAAEAGEAVVRGEGQRLAAHHQRVVATRGEAAGRQQRNQRRVGRQVEDQLGAGRGLGDGGGENVAAFAGAEVGRIPGTEHA